MSPDILIEPRISLASLCKREGVSTCTGWRWITKGIAGIPLESFSIGHRRYVAESCYFRWVEAVTAAKALTGSPVPPVTSRTNRRRAAGQRKARKDLKSAGLLPT
jgi:hypothetical protein